MKNEVKNFQKKKNSKEEKKKIENKFKVKKMITKCLI